ncbi:hypothetical protein KL86DYS1_11142 [uncultured Dysgonomonas sp.]|uniref:Uncharacterized protein n=1 Tax=uncultured Dysgonomonas sp. TaxID=206096 RepID=A0A212J4T8_9BACT|nr:hypothetical protein KL86DYS1_11142 [uncultured Dysgonomonas sp.]
MQGSGLALLSCALKEKVSTQNRIGSNKNLIFIISYGVKVIPIYSFSEFKSFF